MAKFPFLRSMLGYDEHVDYSYWTRPTVAVTHISESLGRTGSSIYSVWHSGASRIRRRGRLDALFPAPHAGSDGAGDTAATDFDVRLPQNDTPLSAAEVKEGWLVKKEKREWVRTGRLLEMELDERVELRMEEEGGRRGQESGDEEHREGLDAIGWFRKNGRTLKQNYGSLCTSAFSVANDGDDLNI